MSYGCVVLVVVVVILTLLADSCKIFKHVLSGCFTGNRMDDFLGVSEVTHTEGLMLNSPTSKQKTRRQSAIRFFLIHGIYDMGSN